MLDIEKNDSGVTIVVEAALRTENPEFYWPPKDGEANAYGGLAIHRQGELSGSTAPVRNWHRTQRVRRITGTGPDDELTSTGQSTSKVSGVDCEEPL